MAVRLVAMVDQYQQSMTRVGAVTQQFGNRTSQTLLRNKQAFTDIGIAAAAMGAVAAGGLMSIADAGGQFQASMNQVRAVSGAAGQEFSELSAQARELGASTKFSASEAADGMGFLAMAGFEANDILSALPGTLELAAAGNMDLATAADIASNVLTGFGLEAAEIGRVNDVMAQTFTNTNTSLAQLGEAMKFAAPVAASVGMEIEEVAAAIGLMGNAGIQASMAGTSMRAAMARLVGPTAQVSEVIDELGLNILDSEGQLVGMVDIVRELERTGADTADMMTLFGLRAGPAMAALVSQGSDALQEQLTMNLESAGKAGEIAEIQMEGFQGAMVELKSAIEGVKIALFEAGIGDFMEASADHLTNFARAVESMPEPVQRLAGTLLGVTAALGLLGGGTLLLLPRIAAVQQAVVSLGVASTATRTSLVLMGRFLTNPYVLAFALAVGAVTKFSNAKREAQQRVDDFVAAIQADSQAIGENTRAHAINELATRESNRRLLFFTQTQESAFDTAQRYGLSLEQVTDAAMGDAQAHEQLHRQLTQFFQAQDASIQRTTAQELAYSTLTAILGDVPHALAEAREEADRLALAEGGAAAAAVKLRIALEDTEYAATTLTPAAGGVTEAAGEAGDAALLAGEDFEDLAGTMEEAASVGEVLLGVMEQLAGGTLDLDRAAIGYVESVESLIGSLSEHGATLDVHTEKGRENLSAVLAVVDATHRHVSALADSGATMGDIRSTIEQHIEQLRGVMRQAGFTEAEIEELIERYGLVPSDIMTRVIANVDDSQLDSLTRQLEMLASREWVTTVRPALAGAGITAEAPSDTLRHRQHGGPVWPGEPFVVGEEGPELVTFGRRGTVHPADDTQRMLAMSGPMSPATPGVGAGGRASRSVSYDIDVHNPKPERASESLPQAVLASIYLAGD